MHPDIYSARVAAPDLRVPSRPPAPELSVVIPIFNEDELLIPLYRRIMAVLKPLGMVFELVFVNDGSRDASPLLLNRLAAFDSRVVVVHLSRNFGRQRAVSAGLDTSRGAAVAVMDGDLQDPPEMLPELIDRWRNGSEVVHAVPTGQQNGRRPRLADLGLLRLLRPMHDSDSLRVGDRFYLMDRKVVEVLKHLPEQVRFVCGVRQVVGFRQLNIEYERSARRACRSKNKFRQLLALAVGGLGMVGTFVWRMVVEVQNRPAYIVREVVRGEPAASRAA